jgi:curved DNA-binding protein CbpA
MTKTLYDVLGVDDEADEKVIKKAYREKVKTCHPDIGGDPLEFQEVQRAYDVLSDPERRAKYDNTGEVDDEAKQENPAIRILADIFERVVDSKMPPTMNYVESMKEILRNSLSEIQSATTNNKGARSRYNVLIKKFKKKNNPKDNMFKAALEAKLRDCDEKERSINGAKAGLEAALKMLDDYEFEVDPQPPMTEPMEPSFTFKVRRNPFTGGSTT